MASVEWVEPALLWEGRKLESIKRPRLLEFQSDDFMAEFLAAMASKDMNAPATGYLKGKVMDGSKSSLKLYQPLHGSFYLVTASLVCRQLGLPDKSVVRKRGERTAFVIRRYNTVKDASGKNVQQEEGWVDEGANKGWQPLSDAKGRPVAVRSDEERFPLHPVTVCTKSVDATGRMNCCERTLYHGYLAAGNREKYVQKLAAPAALTPTAVLSNYLKELKAVTDTLPAGSPDKTFDFRVDEFDSRVIAAWQALRAADAAKGSKGAVESARVHESSLYILLDLADNLERMLPTLWKALVESAPAQLNGMPKNQNLYHLLNNTTLLNEASTGDDVILAQALRNLKDKIGLVRGEEIALPTAVYNLIQLLSSDENGTTVTTDQFVGVGAGAQPAAPPKVNSKLTEYVAAALTEEPQPMATTEELAGLLRDQVKLEAVDASGKEIAYFLRLVYEYDPLCPPIVSQSSQPFRFAKFFEPDAPARHIRIELPSIKMSDLRKYKKGVGLQMSPELRDVMNRIHKGMADGEPLLPGGGSWGLGMICSFSLQIIFLIAFIVMFIFMIMLNIVFWWMAFLKICFPIPMKSGA